MCFVFFHSGAIEKSLQLLMLLLVFWILSVVILLSILRKKNWTKCSFQSSILVLPVCTSCDSFPTRSMWGQDLLVRRCAFECFSSLFSTLHPVFFSFLQGKFSEQRCTTGVIWSTCQLLVPLYALPVFVEQIISSPVFSHFTFYLNNSESLFL